MNRFLRRLCSAWMLVLLLWFAARCDADQTIYDESLQNGWQNWSWCGVNFGATSPVHAGSKSVQVTFSGAWQGFYLHHDNFDTSLYTSLRFWINGGSATGRTINVAGLLNGTSQAAVPLSKYVIVTAGAWKQVQIPLTDLHCGSVPNFSGFWLQEGAGAAQSTFYVDDIALVSAPPPSVIHLNVNAAQLLRQFDSRLFGMNAAVWDNQFGTTATVTQLKNMGAKVLRFPGGSLSDSYHWKTNTTDGTTWQWATSFDTFAATAKSAGADAYITVNYGSGSAQEAADWVTYSNKTKKYGFHYWEIGNECYGSWENDWRSPAHDPYTYAVQAKAYITKMKAVDPTIKVGVVVIPGEDTYANNTNHPVKNPRTGATHNGWTPVLLATLKSLGVTPDFVIHHRYEQGPGQESDSALLQSAAGWQADATDLRQQITDYLGMAGATVELDCTENNSVYTNPGKQSTSLVNGLYYADSMGRLMQTEFRSLVWWNFRNGGTEAGNNNSASLFGWRNYGDYGVIESGGAFPVYYIARLMSLFAAGGDAVLPASSDYAMLSVYAVKHAAGTVSLLVINKSPSVTLNSTVALTGFKPQSSAVLYSYGIPQDDNARTGKGSADVAQSSLTNAAPTFSASFAPYSATVITLKPQ